MLIQNVLDDKDVLYTRNRAINRNICHTESQLAEQLIKIKQDKHSKSGQKHRIRQSDGRSIHLSDSTFVLPGNIRRTS